MGTNATFKAVNTEFVKKIMTAASVSIRVKGMKIVAGSTVYKYAGKVTGLPEFVEYDGVKFRLHKTSVGGNFSGVSIYYHSMDGKTLMRLSDHWTGVDGCEAVRDSNWQLVGNPEPVGYHRLRGGICAMPHH